MSEQQAKADKLKKLKATCKQSGITGDRFREFMRLAKDREELYGNLPGFFYIKLGNGGSWRLRYTDPDGAVTKNGKPKRVTSTLPGGDMKPTEAYALAQEWRTKIEKGINPATENRQTEAERDQAAEEQERRRFARMGVFFKEIYSPHIEEISKAGRETLNIIRGNFSHLFDRDMDGLTLQDIRAWENKRRKDGVSRATLQRALAALKGMLSYAAGTKKGEVIEQPVIASNPLAGLGLKEKTAAERDAERLSKYDADNSRHILSPEEFAAIDTGLQKFAEQVRTRRENSRRHGKPYLPSLDGLRFAHWFEPFFHLARLTGARPGDLLRLRWNNVQTDLRARCDVLRFTPHKTERHKNPIEVVFPITGELAAVLKAWRQQQGNPQSGLIFPSERTGGMMTKGAYQRHWQKIKELAGLPPNLDLYNLRHTFISERVNAGWPLLRLAKLVGHRDASMIAENYYRDDLEDLSALLQAMESTQPAGEDKARASA